MVTQHFRWDFVGLSTDTKPTPETSEKVVDGSTFYCSDTSKLYVFCKNDWYERKPLGGGGGGTTYTAGDGITIADDTISVDLAQTTGSSTTKVMSQKATTDFVDGLIKAGSQPTTSTVGTLGQLYEDTTNGDLYICTDATNPYVWEQVGAGGGGSASGVTELTSADYNWPTTGTKTSVALWLLDDGIYVAPGAVLTRLSTTVNNGGSGWVVVKGTTASDKTSYLVYNGSAQSFDYYANPTNGSGAPGGERFFIKSNMLEQSTGTSTTSVMSQNATTSMVFADPANKEKIQIGASARSLAIYEVSLGGYAGGNSSCTGSVNLGAYSKSTRAGEVNVGTGTSGLGYNSSDYRIIGGVHDGQDAHDAVTVGQVNAVIDAINTALSTNIPHIGASS